MYSIFLQKFTTFSPSNNCCGKKMHQTIKFQQIAIDNNQGSTDKHFMKGTIRQCQHDLIGKSSFFSSWKHENSPNHRIKYEIFFETNLCSFFVHIHPIRLRLVDKKEQDQCLSLIPKHVSIFLNVYACIFKEPAVEPLRICAKSVFASICIGQIKSTTKKRFYVCCFFILYIKLKCWRVMRM